MSATLTDPTSGAVPVTETSDRTLLHRPSYQAFLALWLGFTVAPIAFGLDKFFDVLVDWEQYLAPEIVDLVPGSAHQIMLGVGVVEIVAGLVVALRPRRRLPRRRLARRDHRQPAPPGGFLRHRPAGLRPPDRAVALARLATEFRPQVLR